MTQNTKPRIAIIIGSTRASRFADKPAAWMLEQTAKRDNWDAEIVDIRDFDLPLFDEVASNLWVPSQNENVVKWQEKLAGFDGYIFVTAEYNHSITGALKNAFDQAGVEWARKPAAAIGYGGLGASRAVEHLRTIAVELQMVPLRNAVHIGGGDFIKVHPMGENGPISEIEGSILTASDNMLEELDWWVNVTRAGRAETVQKAA